MVIKNSKSKPQATEAKNVKNTDVKELYKDLFEARKLDVKTFAFKLLIGVGGFIALISIIIISFYLINLIRIGIPTTTLTETELADFESLSKIFFDHTTQLFDLIITKGFLPIFATILGYLLGEARATNE